MTKIDLLPFHSLLTDIYKDGRGNRLVGRGHNIDSGYFDIHRFYGEKSLNPAEIKIIYNQKNFSFRDDLLAKYASEIEESLRNEGRLYDGPLVTKLVSQTLTKADKKLEIQSATYGQFAGSCFCLDREHNLFKNYGGTLRSYELTNSKLGQQAVEINRLAICFGVSAMILVRHSNESFLLRTRRSKHLATLTGSIGGTVAGVVDYCKGIKNLKQLALKALTQELSEEVNLTDSEYSIIPLAYARELVRGEHPQLFALVITDISKDEMISKLESIEEKDREFDWYDLLKLNFNHTIDLDKINEFNFEGRMNYYLMEEYLDFSINVL